MVRHNIIINNNLNYFTMKKEFLTSSMIVGMCSISLMFLKTQTKENSFSYLLQEDIEAITACESIGWWDNDGNCVKNSKTNQYFCKDDTWYEITDCLR